MDVLGSRGRSLARAEQHALFTELVVSRHPAPFGESVLSLDRTAPFELAPRVETFLDAAPALVPTMRRLSDQLEARQRRPHRLPRLLPRSGQREDLPKRVGYYVGLRVAEIFARGRSAREFAALADPVLRGEIEAALVELAG